MPKLRSTKKKKEPAEKGEGAVALRLGPVHPGREASQPRFETTMFKEGKGEQVNPPANRREKTS